MPSFLCVCLLCFSILIGFVSYGTHKLLWPPPLPKIDENIWWGPGEASAGDKTIREFTINIPEKDIADLKWRLDNHRPLVPTLEGTINHYGTNSIFLKEIIEFWRTQYNWTDTEALLNKYPQFKTNIQGLDIHFIHIKPKVSKKKKVLPLLLLHGWPGSVREFYEAIEILTDSNSSNNFNLELVVPSIPGYGFSQSASKPGLSIVQVGVIVRKLMMRLGHEKFYCQGGDMGGLILQSLSILYPDSVLGFHSNFPTVYTIKSYIKPLLGLLNPSWVVRPDHYDRVYPLVDKGIFIFEESGYLHLQCTKPDSLGPGINDSPIGLAAYFLEKFLTGTNFEWRKTLDIEKLKQKFSYTKLLDNLMIYWVTGTAQTSFRLYYETFGKTIFGEALTVLRNPVKVPTVIARYKNDLYTPDGVLSEIYPNLLLLSDYGGGHFAAFEDPALFSKDVLQAIELFEKYHVKNKFDDLYRLK